MFDRPLAAFDIETIPDPDIGRRVHGLEGDDSAVVHQMVKLRLEETEGRTEYPQLAFHRVVAICVAWFDPTTTRFKLGKLGGRAMDERSHLEGFFTLFRDSSPRLISWNGNGFDLPVIRYRSILHGIPAPEFYRTDGDRQWNHYQNRYHDMHVDLMDVLSGRGASHFEGLGRMCDLLGIPGKEFLTRPLYDHILDGEDRIVQEYCKLDCVDTLLVFLAWTIHTGQLKADQFQGFMSVIREALGHEDHEGWKEIAAELEGWPASRGAAPEAEVTD